MRRFRIVQSGAGLDLVFAEPLSVLVRVCKSRKKYTKLTRAAGQSKTMSKTSDASFHAFSKAKDGCIGQMFLMEDSTKNTIIHESIHAGIRMAHEHFGTILLLDQDDTRAHQEEAVAYIAADLAEAILAAH